MGREVVAVVAAAGQGTRLGADVPKAYVELRGRTLVERSVAAMEAAGIRVSPSPARLGKTLVDVLKG